MVHVCAAHERRGQPVSKQAKNALEIHPHGRVRDGIYKEFDSWLGGSLVLDADSGEQSSGLDVLLLVGGLQQTQTPYFTSIGSIVSRVSSELLSVCGLQGVDSGGLNLSRQSALLFHS